MSRLVEVDFMYGSFTSSFETFIYTKTAAGQILGGVCQKLEIWSNCVWAIVSIGVKKLCRFISKKRFLSLFAASRMERGRGISVNQNSHNPRLFSALSSQGDRVYSITVHDRFLSCTCEDFRNQCRLFGESKPKACKHVYAVLFHLGYSTLRGYLDRTWDHRLNF